MLDLIQNILRRFLAPSQDGVRLLFEQAPFGVAMVDTATGAVVSVNDNFASLVGRTASSLDQAPWSTLVRSVWQAGQTQAPDLFDQPPAAEGQVHQLLRTDDARIFAEISVFARLTDRRGQSVCVVMVKDVSKQVAAQAQLRVSEERLRVLTDSALDVVWTMSPMGELTYVSPAIEQLRGYTPEEAMKHTIDQTLTPDSQVVSLQYFVDVATAMQQGLPPPEFRSELEYWRKDGTRFWTEVLAFPLLGTDGSLVEILGVSRDISQRRLYEDSLRQARQRAEQANAAKTEFLAHVSHEIRTPMGAIGADGFGIEYAVG
jgi:PAS domain S-box-containing protein